MKKYQKKVERDTKTTSVNLDKDVLKMLRAYAKKMGVSNSSIVNEAMKERMRRPLEQAVRVFSKADEMDAMKMTVGEMLERLK